MNITLSPRDQAWLDRRAEEDLEEFIQNFNEERRRSSAEPVF
jgi:hypothetical protein